MMKTQKQQRGLTFIGLLIILLLIAFFTTVTLKIVPLYMEFASVSAALDQLPHQAGLGKKGKRSMIAHLDKQFDIDSVNMDPKTFEYKKVKTGWEVTADYEAKNMLFQNIGVFVHFQKTVSVPK